MLGTLDEVYFFRIFGACMIWRSVFCCKYQ